MSGCRKCEPTVRRNSCRRLHVSASRRSGQSLSQCIPSEPLLPTCGIARHDRNARDSDADYHVEVIVLDFVCLCFAFNCTMLTGGCKFCNNHSFCSSPSSNTFLMCCREMVDLLRWNSSAIWSRLSHTVSPCSLTSMRDSPSGV